MPSYFCIILKHLYNKHDFATVNIHPALTGYLKKFRIRLIILMYTGIHFPVGSLEVQNKLRYYLLQFCLFVFLAQFSFTTAFAEVSNDVLLEKINSLYQTQTMILEQIRNSREDMNKRFEQVDKRFEFVQNLLVALIVILVGSTIYSVLGKSKEKNIYDNTKIKEFIEREERLEKVVNAIVNNDKDLKRKLQTTGLL